MFESFQSFAIDTGGVVIRGVHNLERAGGKPPLLLLHGYPQSHVIWHRVAPLLADDYALVLPDLRGYGKSDKPSGSEDHSNYSKRVMARDQLEVMRALGLRRFFVCGHDRGGRVAHRLASDAPEAVVRLMVLDISPTLTMYEGTTMEFARSYWWWFFLIQPSPLPETLIGASAEAYLAKKLGTGSAGLTPFSDEAYASYLAGLRDPATVHGMCEDYRAAASIDLEHDRADRDSGKRIQCPVRVLWGERGVVNRCFHPVQDWRAVTAAEFPVTGRTLPGGHYIPEELPALLVSELRQFMV